jgi:hypothetical protein
MGLRIVMKVCGLEILQKKTYRSFVNVERSSTPKEGWWEKNEKLQKKNPSNFSRH